MDVLSLIPTLLKFIPKYDLSWRHRKYLLSHFNDLEFTILKALYEVPTKVINLTWCIPGNSTIQVGTYYTHILPEFPKEALNDILNSFNKLVKEGILEEQESNDHSRKFKLTNSIGLKVLMRMFKVVEKKDSKLF